MTAEPVPVRPATATEVFIAFLRLGLTSFGGPVAHLGYFHQALIVRRRWLDEQSYADIVGLCQFLPGPASSQVGIVIGLAKAGWQGAVAAWLGFTLPSAVVMTLIGLGLSHFRADIPAGLLHGLILVAVPVVAQAVWLMARQLCPDMPRRILAVLAGIILLLANNPMLQPVAILAGGIVGLAILKTPAVTPHSQLSVGIGIRFAVVSLVLFFALLAVSLTSSLMRDRTLAVAAGFYRSASLVFGGGHVVLPLLQASVVPQGWVSNDAFLAGYGAAQAMPGPLFSFASYLGTVMKMPPNGIAGSIICLLAIYLPSFLLVVGALPFWDMLRHQSSVRDALAGVNATVVGLLLAALYNPVWTSAVHGPTDMAIALAGFGLLMVLNMPAWLVVAFLAAGSWLLSTMG